MNHTPGYRRTMAAIIVIVGIVATILLGSTVLNTSPTQVAAPQALIGLPEFEGRQSPQTDFYQVPADFNADLAPGTLLSSQPIEEAPDGIRAERIIYVSQTAQGDSLPVSGYFVTRESPSNEPAGRPLVAVAHGTTGIAPGCGVSQAPFTPGSTGFGTWDQIISGLVGAGFSVVATDYANLGVPGVPNYLTMDGQGHDVLNSIRAAYALDRAGLNTAATALLGHSQGGHAALSAAYIAPDYAPEISLQGTVAIAPALFPPAPVIKQFIGASPDEDAASFLAFVSNIVTSYSESFPGQLSPDQVFTEKGLAANAVGNTKCQDALNDAFEGPKGDFLLPDLPNSIVTLAGQNFPVYEKYKQPVLIQQGLEDTTVVPAVNIAAARTFCAFGSEVNLQTYPEDVHSTVLYTGQAGALAWLLDRFAGTPVTSDCGGL